MDLYSVTAKLVKEELTKEHTLEILKTDLLAIRLREKIILPDQKEVLDDPIKVATSKLLAADGSKVFWLLAGGLMESGFKLTRQIVSEGLAGPIGFSTNGLLDFFSFLPHSIHPDASPAEIIKKYRFTLPITPEHALHLLPGSTFQVMGRGTASLSGSLHYGKGVFSASAGVGTEKTAVFSVRLIRGSGNTVRLALSRIHRWQINPELKAGVGVNLEPLSLIQHEWLAKAGEHLDAIDLEQITAAIPGWEENTRLPDFIKANSIGQLGKILQQYSSFYAKLGIDHSQQQQHLVGYEFDLNEPEAREAFSAMLHLDEATAAQIASQSTAVRRQVYDEDETITKQFFELGFPGKKLLLSYSLRSEREGFLVYDGSTQIIRSAKSSRNYRGIFSGNREIAWEGLEVMVNSTRSSHGYWKFSFKNHDKYSSEQEVTRLILFAALLGVKGVEQKQITDYPWHTRLFSREDDTEMDLILYFTSDGLAKIGQARKDEIRELCFATAVHLGYITDGAPWYDYKARGYMNKYLEILADISADNTLDKKDLQEKYNLRLAESSAGSTQERNLEKDAWVYKKAKVLINSISMMNTNAETEQPNHGWAALFQKIGNGQRFNYLVIIGVLARLAGTNGILLDLLELKESETGKILVYADEMNTLISGEELFTQASQQITGAHIG